MLDHSSPGLASAPPRAGRAARFLPAVAAAAAVAALSALWLWAAPAGVSPWLLLLFVVSASALVSSAYAIVIWRHRHVAAPKPPAAPRREATEADLRDRHTGMFHRPAFLALAQRDWQLAGRHGGAVALLLIEVDRLRGMTDQSGPAVADALLSGLGRQVLPSLRAADLLARFDPAQLAVFLPHADPTGAVDVADRIRAGVEQLKLPGLPEGAAFSASIGVAVMQPLHQPLDALLRSAQDALRTARQAGGNCVRMAPPAADEAGRGAGPRVGGGASRPGRDGKA